MIDKDRERQKKSSYVVHADCAHLDHHRSVVCNEVEEEGLKMRGVIRSKRRRGGASNGRKRKKKKQTVLHWMLAVKKQKPITVIMKILMKMMKMMKK
jgi:hypothetical protein